MGADVEMAGPRGGAADYMASTNRGQESNAEAHSSKVRYLWRCPWVAEPRYVRYVV